MIAALKGIAAGATGVTALNTATYFDMTVRGRGTSSMPEQTVAALAERIGQQIPGSEVERDNRVEALGALSGIATGCGVGLVARFLQPVLRRLPLVVSGALIGAGAMAVTDVTMARLGLTDPATWSGQDWVSDAAPHFVYGLTVAATLRALDDAR